MRSHDRRGLSKEDVRRAILDATRVLIAAHDYKAVTIRKIAAQIGYSPGTIYLYFKDKADILVSLCEEGFALLSAELEKIEAEDALVRLRRGARVYLQFAHAQPHYYRIMYVLEEEALVNRSRDDLEMARATFRFLRRCVAQAMQQGQFRSSEQDAMVARMLWAHIHGAASLALSGRLGLLSEETRTAFFELVIDTTLRGLRPCP